MIFHGTGNNINVQLYINTTCNLRCPYCFIRNGMLKGKEWIMSLEKVMLIKKFIPENCTIHLIGGEPTIHKDFLKIVKLFADHKIEVFTNGTRKLLSPAEIGENVSYSCTFHQEMSKKFGRERFLENIKDAKIFKVRVMLDGPKSLDDFDFFVKHGFETELRPLSGHPESIENLPQRYKTATILKQDYFLDGKKLNVNEALKISFKGWHCQPSVIIIFPDLSGYINCKHFRLIRNFKNLTPIICNSEKCDDWFLDGLKYDHT